MSELKIFKLINGDDIIGFLETYTNEELNQIDAESEEQQVSYDHLFFIRDPMKMYWKYDPVEKRHELFLAKWCAFSDDSLYFVPKDTVMTVVAPSDVVTKHYQEISELDFPPIETVEEGELSIEKELEEQYKSFLETWEPFGKENNEEKKKKMN